jgi:hypothetical protein
MAPRSPTADDRTARRERGPVISEGLCQTLEAYLSFRHFARHAYAFHLKWVRLRPLVFQLHDTWSQTKHELTAFLASLPTASD